MARTTIMSRYVGYLKIAVNKGEDTTVAISSQERILVGERDNGFPIVFKASCDCVPVQIFLIAGPLTDYADLYAAGIVAAFVLLSNYM